METVEYFIVSLSTNDHGVVLFPVEANVTVTDGDGELQCYCVYPW